MIEELATRLTEEMGIVLPTVRAEAHYDRPAQFCVAYNAPKDFQRALVFATFELGQDNSADGVSELLEELANLTTDRKGLGIVVY